MVGHRGRNFHVFFPHKTIEGRYGDLHVSVEEIEADRLLCSSYSSPGNFQVLLTSHSDSWVSISPTP
jgi:hypothetical protein